MYSSKFVKKVHKDKAAFAARDRVGWIKDFLVAPTESRCVNGSEQTVYSHLFSDL